MNLRGPDCASTDLRLRAGQNPCRTPGLIRTQDSPGKLAREGSVPAGHNKGSRPRPSAQGPEDDHPTAKATTEEPQCCAHHDPTPFHGGEQGGEGGVPPAPFVIPRSNPAQGPSPVTMDPASASAAARSTQALSSPTGPSPDCASREPPDSAIRRPQNRLLAMTARAAAHRRCAPKAPGTQKGSGISVQYSRGPELSPHDCSPRDPSQRSLIQAQCDCSPHVPDKG